jgi:hypothetical protein
MGAGKVPVGPGSGSVFVSTYGIAAACMPARVAPEKSEDAWTRVKNSSGPYYLIVAKLGDRPAMTLSNAAQKAARLRS